MAIFDDGCNFITMSVLGFQKVYRSERRDESHIHTVVGEHPPFFPGSEVNQ
jgi:hypothetical protein